MRERGREWERECEKVCAREREGKRMRARERGGKRERKRAINK